MMRTDRSLMALSRGDCMALLASKEVGRAVFTERAMPAIVPVAFAVLDDAVVMCTGSATRLASAATRGVLAFQVDEIDPSTRSGWSVVVIGLAERVDSLLEQARIRCLLEPWPPGHNDVFIRLPIKTVTGRCILASGEPDPTGATEEKPTATRN